MASRKTRGVIHVGTSGWHYDHWTGPFYPEGTAAGDRLAYYCSRFAAVEVNNSFYQLPSARTLAAWRDAVPPGFVFAAKASRYITHMKKLKDSRAAAATFFDRIATLGPRLGPILFQLPPRWRFNPERLETFLARLPEGPRCAFEFRDPSWFDQRCLNILARHGAAFCIYELAGEAAPREVTADFVYVRLHGPGEAYQGRYRTPELAGWAGAFHSWAGQGREIFCFFDNDQNGYAALNALELRVMVGSD
jgi:uncharacterized protein YecE (DUF72 family)